MTRTPRGGLEYWSYMDAAWHVNYERTVKLLESFNPVTALAVTKSEEPSTTLNVRVAPGSVVLNDGSVGTFAGATLGLADDTTTYLWLDEALALQSGAAFPAGFHTALAVVDTADGLVTDIVDAREVFRQHGGDLGGVFLALAGGTLEDGANIQTGTTTGTVIATTTAQKLAFHGATPVAQRSGAAQVAVATTAATNASPYGYSTAAQADAIVALVNELRAAMVAKGLIKGSA